MDSRSRFDVTYLDDANLPAPELWRRSEITSVVDGPGSDGVGVSLDECAFFG
jgi:hypothetical protein